MQSLQQKASEWSGVSIADAFAIDEANLFHKLGLQTLVNLSTNFYNRVYDDDQEWFRSIFANSDKQNAIQNQIEFLVQRMGGPTLYSQRRGALLIYFISYQPYCFIIYWAVFKNFRTLSKFLKKLNIIIYKLFLKLFIFCFLWIFFTN